MILFSLIILCLFAIIGSFLFLSWMPSILFWLLLLLIVLFLFTHIVPILVIIAIIWGISYYRKKQRTEQFDGGFTSQTAGPRDLNEVTKQGSTREKVFKNHGLARVQKDFEERKALNLGDGLWIDQAGQELLLVTEDKTSTGYIQASFSDVLTYFTSYESDYSQTFAIHFAGMAEQDFANVTLSKQENDLLGQSPAAYLQALLSRYGMPLKKQ
ncbi:hypothetical protein [Fructobacillus parabroussonetiae]|uniref:Uncharacterized protein n=1 Tax=Fructobacillus parabroussonetiae TaxID=2713174 RepID=A0ABS5QUX7_9LACO|nr:hypothetical protein [Fructobacillus parabroussonetiae]MBS9336994.1 hypothetical protein [Fructobacillus parabroussonetiae]